MNPGRAYRVVTKPTRHLGSRTAYPPLIPAAQSEREGSSHGVRVIV